MDANDLIKAAKEQIAFDGRDLYSAVDPVSLEMATVYAAIAQAEALTRIAAVMEADRADVERKAYAAEMRMLVDDDEPDDYDDSRDVAEARSLNAYPQF